MFGYLSSVGCLALFYAHFCFSFIVHIVLSCCQKSTLFQVVHVVVNIFIDLGYLGIIWDVSDCVTFDVVFNVSIVVLFFCVGGKFCVVFALLEVVFLIVLCCRQLCCVCFHGCLLCFNSFSLLWVGVGGGKLQFVSIVSSSFSLSRIFELFKIVVRLLASVKCSFRSTRSSTFSGFSSCSVWSGFLSNVQIGLGCVWLLFSGSSCVMLF